MSAWCGTISFMSPEQILQTKYLEEVGLPSDIWSAGLIFSEILSKFHGFGWNKDQKVKRWSLMVHGDVIEQDHWIKMQKLIMSDDHEHTEIVRRSQMRTIWNVDQKDDSLSFLKENTLKKIETDGLTQGIIPFDLGKLFPNDDDAINLLQGMLNYNPYHRPTAEECLNHPYFSDFKDTYQRPEVKQLPEVSRSIVDS